MYSNWSFFCKLLELAVKVGAPVGRSVNFEVIPKLFSAFLTLMPWQQLCETKDQQFRLHKCLSTKYWLVTCRQNERQKSPKQTDFNSFPLKRAIEMFCLCGCVGMLQKSEQWISWILMIFSHMRHNIMVSHSGWKQGGKRFCTSWPLPIKCTQCRF